MTKTSTFESDRGKPSDGFAVLTAIMRDFLNSPEWRTMIESALSQPSSGKPAEGDLWPSANATETPKDRIVLNAFNKCVTIDGEALPLTETAFTLIELLHKYAPGWVKPEVFALNNVIRSRPGVVIKRLPQQLRDAIESIEGKGTRLKYK